MKKIMILCLLLLGIGLAGLQAQQRIKVKRLPIDTYEEVGEDEEDFEEPTGADFGTARTGETTDTDEPSSADAEDKEGENNGEKPTPKCPPNDGNSNKRMARIAEGCCDGVLDVAENCCEEEELVMAYYDSDGDGLYDKEVKVCPKTIEASSKFIASNGEGGCETGMQKYYIDLDGDDFHSDSVILCADETPTDPAYKIYTKGLDCDDEYKLIKECLHVSDFSFKLTNPSKAPNKYVMNEGSLFSVATHIKGTLTHNKETNHKNYLSWLMQNKWDMTFSSLLGTEHEIDLKVINGKTIEFEITILGMPESNNDFGEKDIKFMDNATGEMITQEVLLFFRTYAKDNGNFYDDGTLLPNWFYYFQEGGVCGIDENVFYGNNLGFTSGYADLESNKILLGTLAVGEDSPITLTSKDKDLSEQYSPVTVGADNKGIHRVASVIAHEQQHIINKERSKGKTDSDDDRIADEDEATYMGIKTNPNDSDTYNVSGAVKVSEYKEYGDDELRCRSIEANHSIPVHPEKDWSDKGDQY